MSDKINPVRGPHNQYNIHLKSDAAASPIARLVSNGISFPEHSQTSPKKRVLFVITQSEIGGAQRFLHALITNLDKTKYEMLIAAGPAIKRQGTNHRMRASPQTENKEQDFELLDYLKQGGFDVKRIKNLKREINLITDLKAIFEIKKLITEFSPDILFLLSSKAGFLGSLVSKFLIRGLRFKVIYRIGGWSFNDPGPKWKRWLWVYLEHLSAKWKDVIIVNSKMDFDQANIFKIKPRDKIQLIYNGLDVYKINFMGREEARLKLFEKAARHSGRIFNAEIIIGTIANFYPSKGLEYLIETAEYFKNNNIVFIVIGDGIEHPSLEKLITEKSLEKKVLLLGQLPDAYRFMPAFDIFILPSVKEGFPWVVIEAMAAKLPVVTTRVGAVPEIIEDSKNGMLVEPARPEQIAKKIKELINNGYLRQELGIRAHQTVLFKFSLEKMIKEFGIILDQ